MKKNKNNIPYNIRVFLETESISNLTLEIFEEAKKENKFSFYPKKVNECLQKAFPNQKLFYVDKKAYEENIDYCYKLLDNQFITLLIKEKVITGKYDLDEDSNNIVLDVKKINTNRFNKLVKWVKEKKYILNYGLFSLNTLTGEAYFKDHKTIFRPGTGYYNLLKELITTDKSYLSFDEIVKIQRQKKLLHETEDIKEFAKEIIKHLKRKLTVKSDLLTMHERIGFTLLKGI